MNVLFLNIARILPSCFKTLFCPLQVLTEEAQLLPVFPLHFHSWGGWHPYAYGRRCSCTYFPKQGVDLFGPSLGGMGRRHEGPSPGNQRYPSALQRFELS